MHKQLEKAILGSFIKQNKIFSGYGRVYFGSEFCEYKIPSCEELNQVQQLSEERDFKITLVTPFCTESGLARIENLFTLLQQAGRVDEVVINDWGVLQLLQDRNISIPLILGRLFVTRQLIKQHLQDKPAAQYTFSADFLSFLKKQQIQRLEFNFMDQLRAVFKQLNSWGFKIDYYYPYFYISTSRYCSAPSKYLALPVKPGLPCDRECVNLIAQSKRAEMDSGVYLFGNTAFLKAEKISSDDYRLVDRIVYNFLGAG